MLAVHIVVGALYKGLQPKPRREEITLEGNLAISSMVMRGSNCGYYQRPVSILGTFAAEKGQTARYMDENGREQHLSLQHNGQFVS